MFRLRETTFQCIVAGSVIILPQPLHTTEFSSQYVVLQEPGSSVSIASGYGLDDQAIEVRSPAGA
jgi:hypothetical protein